MDGKDLSGLKQWKCKKNPEHIIGILNRVESSVVVNETRIRYHTMQIMLFRDSVDLSAHVPGEVDVIGCVEGLMLTRMTWKCTICGAERKWNPSEDALIWLSENFGNGNGGKGMRDK